MLLRPGSHLTSLLIISLKIEILSDWHTLKVGFHCGITCARHRGLEN